MSGLSTEALLAAAYAVFLVVAAGALDVMARHTHARSDRYRVAGFSYDDRLDAWRCGEGEHLHRIETDHAMRLARYRARAHVCNACRAKADCTDSDLGREIARPLDPWPHSEAGRFHRGISLALLALAAVILVADLVRHHSSAEAALLGVLLAIVIAVGIRAAATFRAAPTGFPEMPPGSSSG